MAERRFHAVGGEVIIDDYVFIGSRLCIAWCEYR